MSLPEIQDHTVDRKVGCMLIRAFVLTRTNMICIVHAGYFHLILTERQNRRGTSNREIGSTRARVIGTVVSWQQRRQGGRCHMKCCALSNVMEPSTSFKNGERVGIKM